LQEILFAYFTQNMWSGVECMWKRRQGIT
jgi:hypothetical protein